MKKTKKILNKIVFFEYVWVLFKFLFPFSDLFLQEMSESDFKKALDYVTHGPK